MKYRVLLAGVCLGLASCQSSGTSQSKMEWVQFQYGDVFEVADAKCRMMAQTQAQGIYARGDAGFVLGAHLGNAIGNAIRIEQFYKQCMTISGWKQMPVQKLRPVQTVAAAPLQGIQCQSVSAHMQGRPVTASRTVQMANGVITIGGTLDGGPSPARSVQCAKTQSGWQCNQQIGDAAISITTQGKKLTEMATDSKTNREIIKITSECSAPI